MSPRDWMEKDFYKALGVAKDASAADIKKAYRKLAKQLHPDANPGDAKSEARFKEVSEAYDVLSEEATRKEYDEQRSLFAGGGGRFAPPPGGFGGTATFDMGDLFGAAGGGLGDLFGRFTGGTRRQRNVEPTRGQDVTAEITLGFDEAVRGGTIPLSLSGPGPCTTCRGSGARAGTSSHRCANCNGSGFVSRNQGAFGFSEPCRECRGTGQIIEDPCPDCAGTGVQDRVRTINVRVPAGVRDGAKLKIAGKGSPGYRGGPSGDLYVIVGVGAHDLFARKGDDLSLTVPITFAEAALGATLRVPTLDGSVSLKVAPGTPSGRTMRVRGRGIAKRGGGSGDLLVTVEVAVPQTLDAESRELLEKYAAAQAEDPRPHITRALGATHA